MAKTFEGGWFDREIGDEFEVTELPNQGGKVLTLKNPIPEKVKPNFVNARVNEVRRSKSE